VKEGIFVEEVMTRVCKTACSAVDSSKGQGADISRTSNVSDSSASSSTASSTIKAAAHVTNCSTIATHRSGNSSSGNSSSGVTEHFDDNTASRGSADAGPDAASAAELAHEMRIVDQQWVSAKGANAGNADMHSKLQEIIAATACRQCSSGNLLIILRPLHTDVYALQSPLPSYLQPS
jgi:hypothetical protein